ncbi:phosphoribosylamine--glycine ligase [Desulfohalobium retbaense]|uniref:Phosphoribosylamine--glycine ligase n=1 Tax=Desulfohalobium retbaense (strain ATCC 49708 / DSM 5692 / JCM 16813 / HR100) TaxID=485915 RepID=C8WZP8_DESRD|nr:phosphoribosylamine--glycine ligase [Desulfohalobium retbaense]ACV67523.1 phosphoribosylamine/glycine ligase [Desulfohalobium retbaense DSM 5692]
MRILLIGSGGREHALAWKLTQSPSVSALFTAPGNGGTAALGENIPVGADDLPALVQTAKDKAVDLVVIGPESPLVLGLRNAMERTGIPCFGPGSYAAQLEGSKAFAKSLMREAEVPTADFEVFDDFDTAWDYVRQQEFPVVIKADGLAAGKGVVLAHTAEEAKQTLQEMMEERVFGTAGNRVVIEEALEGEEASFMAFCDGLTVRPLPSCQDHKAIGEGDTGANTGGMGAYSPAPLLPASRAQEMSDLAITPIIQHLHEMGRPFRGVLYAGLMLTKDGPKVLEYNVRFGDPECQPLMVRLESDLAEIMLACAQGRLKELEITWSEKTSLCVVLAAAGYPGPYPKDMPITGLKEAEALENVHVFHAGTRLQDGEVLASGGRVLGVTALGDDLAQAQQQAYKAADCIHFDNKYLRRDIGDKGLRRLGLK